MIPDIVIFGKTFTPYMFCALAGVLIVVFFTYKLAIKQNLDELKAMNMILFCFIGVFFGGHILYAITNFDYIIKLINNLALIKSFKDFINAFFFIFGGSVFYGGLIGALIVAFIYYKKAKLNNIAYIDLATLSIPLFHFFGRLGCFLSGCCYGIEGKIGFIYHYSKIETANGVRRFPTSLIEAVLNLILFFVLYYLFKNKKAKGKILSLYLIIYPTYRFLLEFLRGDEYRGFVGPFSTSQFVSILLLVSTLALNIIIYIKRQKPIDK